MDLALECVHCTSACVVAVIRDANLLFFCEESLLQRSLLEFGWAFGSYIVDRSAAERSVG
jgi:hypothetical protein